MKIAQFSANHVVMSTNW